MAYGTIQRSETNVKKDTKVKTPHKNAKSVNILNPYLALSSFTFRNASLPEELVKEGQKVAAVTVKTGDFIVLVYQKL